MRKEFLAKALRAQRTLRRIRREAVGDAADAVFDQRDVEVDAETELQAREAQAGQELFFVDVGNFSDRFDFDDHFAFYDHICAKGDRIVCAFINQLNGLLPRYVQSSFFQFSDHNHLVDRFKQSRPQYGVHPIGNVYNLLSHSVLIHTLQLYLIFFAFFASLAPLREIL